MKSRSEIDDELARHPAVYSEPRAAEHRKTHPKRQTLRALAMEARVAVKAYLRNDTPQPFLIYGRPRSGSTLLVRLLKQVPHIRCEGELLHAYLLSPERMLERLPRRAGGDVEAYGVKLLSYQLMEVHRVIRPLAFFDALAETGYRVIHLRRDSYSQTVSLAKAQVTRTYFVGDTTPESDVRVDPKRFMDLLAWNERMLDYEREVMSHVPHLAIDYDTALRDAGCQTDTIGTVCDFLEVSRPAWEVKSGMRRTGGQSGAVRLVNEEDLKKAVRDSQFGHLLP